MPTVRSPVLRFFAFCRLGRTDHPAGQCQVEFDSPALFEEHMADVHQRKPPKSFRPFRLWRPPSRARRSYEPSEHAIGAWVTFVERRNGQLLRRRGQVWSLGPPGEGNSRWVAPDDGGGAMVVKISRRAVLNSQTVLDVVPGHEMHRMNLRRAENVRRFGGVFPVVVDKRWEHVQAYKQKMVEYWCWHADPNCPDAMGKPSPSTEFRPYSLGEIVSALITGSINASTTRFCRRCFWLDTADNARQAR